ncbi:hypothetical protein ACVJMY_002273 [Bradyrhizobium diazoefficiens]
MLYSATINVMVKAARRAGRSLKRDLGEIEHLQVSLKGPANFVSLADKRAEEILYQDLAKARPGYGFIGEEGGTREGTDKSHTWIVDPLDGTTNFLHGIPQFAISIGLAREGTIIAGVIYNPANDELYIAERGKGAFLNDQRLRVAGRRQLNECVGGLRPAPYRPRRPRGIPPRDDRDPGPRRGPAPLRRRLPRPRLRRRRPPRRLLGAQPAILGHRRRHDHGARGRRHGERHRHDRRCAGDRACGVRERVRARGAGEDFAEACVARRPVHVVIPGRASWREPGIH